MKIKIIQSFVIVGHAPFSPGELLTVDEHLAQEWIGHGWAVAVEPQTTKRKKK